MEIHTPLGKRAIKALVDPGSTYNFISQRIVAEQKLEAVDDAPAMKVLNASSHQLRVYECHNTVITTRDDRGQDLESHELLWGADIHGYDAYLGMPWMEKHNPDV